MTFPLHFDRSPIPKLGRILGVIGLTAGALTVANPASAQIAEASIVVQPAPYDSTAEFGVARALSADGNTLIVGDQFADGLASNQGAAYIYSRDPLSPSRFVLTKTLTAPDGVAEDKFGTSVSVSGDIAVVGAQGTDVSGSESGSAYIFYREPNGNWGFIKRIIAADGAADDIFGAAAVAVSDNGGRNDVVAVSATGNDNVKGAEAGAVYVFNRDKGGPDSWGQTTKILPPIATNFRNRLLGRGLVLQNDRLVAGSSGDRVFIFGRNQGGAEAWGTVATLTAADRTAGDQFGEFSIDLDGDRVVVGAQRDTNERGAVAGSVYVFDRNANGDWVQTQKILGADTGPGWAFGTDVAIDGGLVVVGMQSRDSHNRRIGAAYTYRANAQTGLLSEVGRLGFSNREIASGFGRGVELADGTPLVGAPSGDNVTGKDAGTVFAFDLAGARDFGDAPAPYPTTAAANGASHTLSVATFALGAAVDAEAAGRPSADATGDDQSGDDEDGVSFAGALVANEATGVSVSFSGPNASGDQGKLSGWVDFNRDGDWDDEGEWVFQNITLTSGVNALSIATPASASVGNTFARFRLSSAGVNVPTGPANDGEVEDYAVAIMEPAIVPVLNIRRALRVLEGDSGATMTVVTVTLSAAVSSEVRVNYETADGTATVADGDYAAGSGTLVIPAGGTSTSFTLTVNGDTRAERAETFSVVLSNPVNATLANSTANVLIRDNDQATVSFSSDGASLNEGDHRFIVVELSGPRDRRVMIPITVSGNATSGADYQAVQTVVVFNRGATKRRIRIQTIDDAVAEPREAVVLSLTGTANVALGAQPQARFVIRDND